MLSVGEKFPSFSVTATISTDKNKAFETVTGASVFPGPWSDELDQEFEEVYQETVERLGGEE